MKWAQPNTLSFNFVTSYLRQQHQIISSYKTAPPPLKKTSVRSRGHRLETWETVEVKRHCSFPSHVLVIIFTTMPKYSSSAQSRWCSINKQLQNVWSFFIVYMDSKHCSNDNFISLSDLDLYQLKYKRWSGIGNLQNQQTCRCCYSFSRALWADLAILSSLF